MRSRVPTLAEVWGTDGTVRMEEPREETEREALLFGRMLAKGTGLRVERGWRRTGVSFIISLPGRTRIFIDCCHPCTLAASEWQRDAKRQAKKKERASDVEEEKENRKGRDIWARSRARGSFHTFLQSLFLLSSWKELIFMSVLERTLTSHERSTQPHTI